MLSVLSSEIASQLTDVDTRLTSCEVHLDQLLETSGRTICDLHTKTGEEGEGSTSESLKKPHNLQTVISLVFKAILLSFSSWHKTFFVTKRSSVDRFWGRKSVTYFLRKV